MADTKISQLTLDAAPTGDDVIATVNDPGGTPASRKVTLDSLPISAATQAALNAKAAKVAITGATKTKITYNADGIVTAGADATTADVAASTDKNYVTDAEKVKLTNTTGTNSGDQTISDATISLTDITTGNASSARHGFLPKLSGSATDVLKGDGTFGTPASSGAKKSFTYVVAASGGDYTTLGAALAVCTGGESIFVRNGSYTESAITSTAANITIIGENMAATTLACGATTFSQTGNYLTMRNLKITFTTGKLSLGGSYQRMVDCLINKTSTGVGWETYGAHQLFENVKYDEAGNTDTSTYHLDLGGSNNKFTQCDFLVNPTFATSGTLRFNGANTVIQACYFDKSGSGTNPLVALRATGIRFIGNRVIDSVDATAAGLLLTGSFVLVEGCYLDNITTYGIKDSGSNQIIKGNVIYMISSAADGITIDAGMADDIITENFIQGTSAANGKSGILINSSSTDFIVSSNRVRAMATGISIAGSRHLVTSNNLHNSGALSDGGTSTTLANNVA
jgi:predicted RecA/RadA family phage recombinase